MFLSVQTQNHTSAYHLPPPQDTHLLNQCGTGTPLLAGLKGSLPGGSSLPVPVTGPWAICGCLFFFPVGRGGVGGAFW